MLCGVHLRDQSSKDRLQLIVAVSFLLFRVLRSQRLASRVTIELVPLKNKPELHDIQWNDVRSRRLYAIIRAAGE